MSFLLMVSYASEAQTLQGVVTDAATGKPLYPVTVVNIYTRQSTLTDEHGLYVIPASQGNLVTFSYLGYRSVQKVKPISVIIATMNIAMEPTEYQLEEFRIKPGILSRYQLDSQERVETYKLSLQRRPPNPFVSPVSAIAELFSKKAKRTYAFQQIFAEGEIEKFVDSRYTTDLVTRLTGLTGDSIGHFMYVYQMPYDFARTATDLELKMWIRSSYREWLKHRKTEIAPIENPIRH